MDCEVVQRGGGYAGYGLVTILYAGALLHALYRLPACRYRGLRVYSNTPPNGAMRGHGSVDVRHAFETMLDRMAAELGLDPFAVRRANLLLVPHRTINDLQVNSYGLGECLDIVERASGWRERRGRLPSAARGLGMACSHYVSGSAKPVHWTGEPHAVVNLKLDFDGGITVLTGAADIGQGSSTLLAQTVAEVLALPLTGSPSSPTTARHAEGQRQLQLARVVHGWQRGARRRARAEASARRSGRAQAGSRGRRRRMPRRDLRRDRDRSRPRLQGRRRGGARGSRHADGQGCLVDAAGDAGR